MRNRRKMLLAMLMSARTLFAVMVLVLASLVGVLAYAGADTVLRSYMDFRDLTGDRIEVYTSTIDGTRRVMLSTEDENAINRVMVSMKPEDARRLAQAIKDAADGVFAGGEK